ncbi:hypothetical protein PN477_02020 [Spirulina subsalsa CS-330]|nr:hypothetical protein [Spirulina subsalsa]MDB9493390.1 hypothetical protein [Spirulina subsalsa CS-330]
MGRSHLMLYLSLGLALGMLSPPDVLAGSCNAGQSCPPPPLRVAVGQRIQIEVQNRTPLTVYIEPFGGEAIALAPGELSPLYFGTTIRNFSLTFWHRTGATLLATLSQNNPQHLRVDIIAGGRVAGMSAVYLRDDGTVERF